MLQRILLIASAALLAAGCAARNRPAPTTQSSRSLTTRPADDPAYLSLDQIKPRPELDAPAPTTRPASPPVDAIQLYARAVAAQLSGDRNREISLLRDALAIDPDSYALNYALGKALAGSGSGNEASLASLTRAAELDPDHLDVHYELGRQYLNRGNLARAIHHLRLAIQTTDYRHRTEAAARVDLFLGRALQQRGYYRAALESFQSAMHRLDGRFQFRNAPELYYYSARRDVLWVQIGQLQEKLGQFKDALASYGKALEREPDNFAYSAHIVGVLLHMGRFDQARDLAVDLVTDCRASPESLALLRDVYRAMGREEALVDELRKLRAKRPTDRSLLFAVADTLIASGRAPEAEAVLRDAMKHDPADVQIIHRLFDVLLQGGNTIGAARLVVETLARRPETLDDLEPLWARLVRGSMRTRLQVQTLQGLDVPADATASKMYWLARLAGAAGRGSLVLAALEQAVAIDPPFPPAYRQVMHGTLNRADLTEAQRAAAAGQLIERALQHHMPALAAELSGRLQLAQKKPALAADSFAQAMRLGDRSPETAFARATALQADDKTAEAESLLWKIISDHTSFDPAYLMLVGIYRDTHRHGQIDRVIHQWLVADPFSITASLLEVRLLIEQKRVGDAESLLLRLFRDEPDNPVVLDAMAQFYSASEDRLLARLEDERSRHPDNRAVVGMLVARYVALKRASDAMRILNDMRAAVKGDADQLYLLADMYQQATFKQQSEDVLQQVLAIDPNFAQANNYLGYMWADDGRNLAQAERMIRSALATEPDNLAFLDSLGWVLYKRGRFEEALPHLEKAAHSGQRGDPVVLDHLGDVLYRLGQSDNAVKLWQQSLEQVDQTPDPREEIAKLKLQLKLKLEQKKNGTKVDVAPVAVSH